MKQRLIVLMVAGALIVTAGTASLTFNARGSKGEEIPSRQVVAKGSKGEEIPSRQVSMRSPFEKDTIQASLDEGGEVTETDHAVTAGTGGEDVSGTNPVQAGGLRGGVVLSPNVVNAGGLRGGVVLNTDHVEAGGISGDTVIAGRKPGVRYGSGTLMAGGKGGICGDMSW